MCKTKMATDAAEPSTSVRTPPRSTSTSTKPNSPTPRTSRLQLKSDPSTSADYSASSYKLDTSRTTASLSSRTSLSSLHETLPENTHIYEFAEIRSATNNFLAKRYSSSSSSSSSWRCVLRGKDVIVFQRNFGRPIVVEQLRERLSAVCRSHHMSIIKLLGASISGDHIYLVYDFVIGASLSDCLRNPRNPNFTVLSNWMSRMQIATDIAHGLDYVHNNTGMKIGLVHKYIKSGSVIVTEPSFNAKICHFAAAGICGETAMETKHFPDPKKSDSGEIGEESPESPPRMKRSDRQERLFEGVRGYMSPEFRTTGMATQKSDVYAFGVVILELLSGEEPLRYKFDRTSGDYQKLSVVEAARFAVEGGGGGEETETRLRRWVDGRLKDSFPMDVAGKVTRLALECVHVDPDKRPGMQRVAGKISKLYLDSRIWSERRRVPTEFSVSFAPR
ncbi:LysM domain receptor-like kinase [Actinidia chinensis var. chinensis]|uniref:LysM domain receptor-like kinase n=1 Tax=Actinidia chinensis var. chinensis TaxID=1590841 RepID=A0A2R6P7H8_ACTCC|nr:LysM domain receptor-like kinase [Actinidia chinensis var. chinensis]